MYELIVLSSVVKALRSQTDGLEGIGVKFPGATGTVSVRPYQKRIYPFGRKFAIAGGQAPVRR